MKDLLISLGFNYKENAKDVLIKQYPNHEKYFIEINLEKNNINFGDKIFFNDSKNSIQNITKPEDLVVLECVNRLLEKGYKPQNIILEKVYPTGHGTSGRLDILVTDKNNKAFMMIECKTWGKEFDKAFDKLKKDGGQLFTYFQQDKDAEILVLYTSQITKNCVEYVNQIVKIEEEYRSTSNVKDLFDRWNKIPKNNGVFDDWTIAYEFVSKALTRKDLKALKQEDSSFIFNRFLEILRHNVVSDKPNAFNKIFTLFLCKIIDEDRNEEDELHFQWLEGEDTHVTFQKRLTDLYNRGMNELLEKKVTDISDNEFEQQFQQVENTYKEKFREILTEIRLKKNNEFAIKEVYDDDSFNENAIVVKEIVELLQNYQIRYNYRQQFLSDFFELLLTTGLKQESGQYFTPVPIARFIIRSIPFHKIIQNKIDKGERNDLLPVIIDYSAGSGHFITESMEEVQKYIDSIDENKYSGSVKKALISCKVDQFSWAENYVYAIEKDYRLVKTAKVSCYLHGDGLAKVIHGDGLDDFITSKSYKDRLLKVDNTYPQDNKQFDIIVSNPPYSVSAFKTMMDDEKAKKNFELYDRLTDQSSEIEALFIERTKQLLKDGGIAGIILPSSILTGGGIYTKTREIILKYFEIIAITELGSNTFMATGTNTVVLFLRRKNNAEHINILASVNKAFETKTDITIKSIEKPLSKYVSYVWENISFEDYVSLIGNNPNENILNHQIYKSYITKYTIDKILDIEKEKFFYFILAYNQKITLVKSGEKQEEKKFLGYEFSSRRGSEGINAIQRVKSIDECTSLYDNNSYENPLKANSYVYSAFNREERNIHESLKENISYIDLIDMMEFSRVDFDKFISLNAKKKVKIESKWEQFPLNQILKIKNGYAFKSDEYEEQGLQVIRIKNVQKGKIVINDSVYVSKDREKEFEKYLLCANDILISMTGNPGRVGVVKDNHLPALLNQRVGKLEIFNKNVLKKFIFQMLNTEYFENSVIYLAKGLAQQNISTTQIESIKIPLPPKDIQQKIINEMEALELFEKDSKEKIEDLKNEIKNQINQYLREEKTLSKICDMKAGKFVSASDIEDTKTLDNYPCYGGNGLRGYTKTFTHEGTFSLIGRQGALCGNVHRVTGQFHATEHALVVTPFENIDTNWLYHKLKEMNLNQYATGVAQPGLSVKNLNDISVLVPSLQEQQQIVKQIEEIENKIQKIEKELEILPTKKEEILKKYL